MHRKSYRWRLRNFIQLTPTASLSQFLEIPPPVESITSIQCSSGHRIGGCRKMLRRIRELGTYRLHATDGDIGHLEQFYFDDRDWKIAYFVVDIGTWLHGKKILMRPSAIIGVDAPTKTIKAAYTKQ